MKRTGLALALLLASFGSLSAAYAPGPLPPQTTTNVDAGATESFELRGGPLTLPGNATGAGPAQALYGGQVNEAVSFQGLTASGATVQVQTATSDGQWTSTLGFYGASGAPAQPILNITQDGKYNFIVGGDTQFRVIETVAGTTGTITYTFGATQNAGRVVAALTPPPSYQLLSNATATGPSMNLAGGSYLLALSGTFGGATVSLTATVNGTTTTLASYTSAPAVAPSFTIATGTVVQAVVSGGSPTGLYATLGGIGPQAGASNGAAPVNPASFATAQATVTTTSAQILGARTGGSGTGRSGPLVVTVKTTTAGTNAYLGPSGVTTTSGIILPCTQGAQRTITTQAAIFGVTDTGSCPVDIQETF